MPPMLIALPQGLSVSGVTMWALRLANGLAMRGRSAGLILHDEPSGWAPLDAPIDPRVRVFDARRLPAFEACNGDLAPFAPLYRHAIDELSQATGGPVVFSPNLAADCFGVAAALSLVMPESMRCVGWLHNDTPYDALVLSHYGPILHRMVGVSSALTGALRNALPTRASDVAHIPYGVEVEDRPPTRTSKASEPIRLLYTGRMDHDQKRVGALLHLADALHQQSVPFTLTLLGDGPASREMDAAARTSQHIQRLAPVGPASVRRWLIESDLLVLPSRFEGLSVSMLEALASGCPPVVAKVESGALDAIEPGVAGVVVDVSPDDEAQRVGQAMAQAIAPLARDRRALARMSHAARRQARERFALASHLDAVEAMLDATASEPARSWPADRPCAFNASGSAASHSSGSVPADASSRLRAVLHRIAAIAPDARVALWGTGRHTIALAAELATSPVAIVGFLDDDPVRAGGALWGWPIASPKEAALRLGATHAVISSWMHEERMWERRCLLEQQGVAVVPLHKEIAACQSAPSQESPHNPPSAMDAA